ncbi:MAG: hypothetical protein IPP34_10855 [Bacteroidetes bacterium]|nr:hypothetical protein [Bacteroidota bacterium]
MIFKYTAGNNSFTETYRLQGIAGSGPQEVVQVGNYIYGGTFQGGAFANGTLYRLNLEPVSTKLYMISIICKAVNLKVGCCRHQTENCMAQP